MAAVAQPLAADLLADGAHGLQRLTRDLEEVGFHFLEKTPKFLNAQTFCYSYVFKFLFF